MKDDTLLVHTGREPERHGGIVNPPVYHASTVLYPTMEAFSRRAEGDLKYHPFDTAHTVPPRRLPWPRWWRHLKVARMPWSPLPVSQPLPWPLPPALGKAIIF